MNLLEGTVKKVLSEPIFKWNKWWVEVEYNCYGSLSKTELMFSTEEKAKAVKIGFTFDC